MKIAGQKQDLPGNELNNEKVNVDHVKKNMGYFNTRSIKQLNSGQHPKQMNRFGENDTPAKINQIVQENRAVLFDFESLSRIQGNNVFNIKVSPTIHKELSKYKFTQLHIKDEDNDTKIYHSDIKIEAMSNEEIRYVERAIQILYVAIRENLALNKSKKDHPSDSQLQEKIALQEPMEKRETFIRKYFIDVNPITQKENLITRIILQEINAKRKSNQQKIIAEEETKELDFKKRIIEKEINRWEITQFSIKHRNEFIERTKQLVHNILDIKW